MEERQLLCADRFRMFIFMLSSMIYKFPKPPKLFKELLPSYKGCYIQLCVPGSDDEKYCYAELAENQLASFTEHFGDNGTVLEQSAEEYPASMFCKTNNRIEKFTIVRQENPLKSFK